MNFNITQTNLKDYSDDIILLLKKQENTFDFLSEKEQDYVKRKIEQDEKLIGINQYHRWIFIQIIPDEELSYKRKESLRKSAYKLTKILNKEKISKIMLAGKQAEKEEILAFIEGIGLSNYQFLKYHTETSDNKNILNELLVHSECTDAKSLEEMASVVDAVYHIRNLINEPLSYLTAVQLAEEIKMLAKEAGFSAEVFNKRKIESLKMGGLIAVNKGSIDPPTFSILEWNPSGAKNKKPLVLVGKGVVYDTGGLSLKPTANSMDYMKCDMSGAAIVAGVIYAIARMQLPCHVIGLIPATDNRPDGNAYAPGDVIRMYNGKTVEVMNTDAEGRMILADALTYAKKYDPELVLEISTLTGSAMRAIGHYGTAAMGNAGSEFFERLHKAGNETYERIVQMPFWDEYAEELKSDIADMKNLGSNNAGSITAGKFLEKFTDYPFIHLDIAGNAFFKKDDHYRLKGGTGTSARLIIEFIKSVIDY